MGAGEMTRKVTIESTTETPNTRGDPIDSAPATFATVWAKYERLPGVTGLAGAEGSAGGQKAFASAFAKWTTRYLPGVLTTMKINDNGVRHDIIGIDDTGRRDGVLVLTTQLRAA